MFSINFRKINLSSVIGFFIILQMVSIGFFMALSSVIKSSGKKTHPLSDFYSLSTNTY
jgi:hypothetical protein